MNGEFYNEIKNKSKIKEDRYRNLSILEDKETGELLLATRDIIEVPTKTTDIFHRVQSYESNRLDILAHKYYKNPLLWWVIAQANDIYDPLESIAVGTMLRIPSIETLYGNRGILL